jgi:hypothetical protein
MPEKTLSKKVSGIRIFLCCLIFFGFIKAAVADHFLYTAPTRCYVINIYDSAPGSCFIENLFGGFGVIDLLFFLGLLIIIITCHVSLRKQDKHKDE